MRKTTAAALVGGLTLVTSLAALTATPSFLADADASPALANSARDAVAAERAQMAAEIRFYEARADVDPFSAGDRSRLAGLYLRRARDTGSYSDVVKAEEFARSSLELRAAHNDQTGMILAASLLEQHRFAEALNVAEGLAYGDPNNVGYRALFGETLLEIGRYEEADRIFLSLEPHREEVDVATRYARWLEINGETEEARIALHSIQEFMQPRPGFPIEQSAWYYLRVGDLDLRHGRVQAAERAFRAGLAIAPDDYRLLAGMARLEAARENWSESIRYGERVIEQQLDAGILGLMSAVLEASGDPVRASEYADVMQVATAEQRSGYHRDWSLFAMDRGEAIEETAALVKEELETRPDIYGYDVLAWAHYKEGDHTAASQAIENAMRLGTEDALVFFHAGMIYLAAGKDDEATRYLERAIAINPGFHPIHASTAAEALKSLRQPRWSRWVESLIPA